MPGTAHALDTAPTLWDLLRRRAELTPHAPALIEAAEGAPDGTGAGGAGRGGADRRITFGELHTRAARTAAGLQELGVRPGDTVAWQLPTRIDTVLLSLALSRLGTVQTPVIPLHRDREVGLAVRATGAGWLLHPGVWRGVDHGALAERVTGQLDRDVRRLVVRGGLPEGDVAQLPAAPHDGHAVRWIYWTSGTTSTPRGVLHTDRSLLAGGACLADALRPTEDDVGSMAFPYAHIGGPDYLVMLLRCGFPAVLVERFALPDVLPGYRRNGVTMAGGSTAFYALFLAEQRKQPDRKLLPTLRLLAGGGAPKPPELYHEVVAELGCQLTHGYGMTEAPMITMGAPEDTAEHLADTEGRPPAAMEVRITDDGGRQLPPGTEGEVRLRGAAVCRGYLDPEQTAAAFDADGFLRTGDLGLRTPQGYLRLTGRLKDVIIRKGENISAKEIEELLYELPAVRDAAVVGLPDADRGELVCAVLEQPEGVARPTLAEVTDHLREAGLAVHKLPERLEVLSELPRNGTLRKVLKSSLRERFTTAGGHPRAERAGGARG